MKSLLFLALFALSAFANLSEDELLSGRHTLGVGEFSRLYLSFKVRFGRPDTYEELRFTVFKQNVLEIVTHNAKPNKTFEMGINNYTDWTWEEFQSFFLINAAQECSATAEASLETRRHKVRGGPYSPVDWRALGIISPVKNQGHCGSCWTFSTTGCLEAHHAMARKISPVLFSEQQLIDCAGDFNNHGCNGGLPSQAFEYLKWAGGINTETDYAYEAVQGQCRFVKDKIVATVPGGAVNITSGDENELLDAVATKGPVSIAYQVTPEFKGYKSGVYTNPNCQNRTDTVNHAVLAVGFGTENGMDYWIVKNSWGQYWGEGGYFKIYRGGNMCGLAVCASYPDVFGPSAAEKQVSPAERQFLESEHVFDFMKL